MKRFTMKKYGVGIVWLVGLGVLCVGVGGSGCGSSAHNPPSVGSGAASRSGTGRAVFTIKWPSRTRLVPQASQSVQIQVRDGDKVLETRLVPRPTDAASSTVEIKDLPAKDLLDVVTAFPNAGGSGIAQAEATAPVKIPVDETVKVPITMESTIDHVDVAPTTATLFPGDTETFTATPRNAAGEQVLITSGTLQWTTSAAGSATVSATGVVTGVTVGTATITVTEPESGKSATVPVTVTNDTCANYQPEDDTEPYAEVRGLSRTVTAGDTVTFQLVLHATGRADSVELVVPGRNVRTQLIAPEQGILNAPDYDGDTLVPRASNTVDSVWNITYTQDDAKFVGYCGSADVQVYDGTYGTVRYYVKIK